MVSGSLDTVVVNRQSIPRGGYPHPPRIVNAITKQQQKQQQQNLHIHQHHHQLQQQQPQHTPFQLRFSDGPLRPWPPMYNTVAGGGSNPQVVNAAHYHGPHQYRSLIAKHNNNYQLYLNNLKNLYAYNTMKSSASSKYNKFMFNHNPHQQHHHQSEGGFMLNAPPNGMMNSPGHMAAAAAAKSKEQHFMQSYFQSQKNMNQQQMYQKASSQYSMKGGGDQGGSSSMSESEQKQIRRLRSTQSMPPPNPCGCNSRSKSMEDIRDVIVDWTVSPKSPPSVISGVGGGPKQKLNNAVLNNGSANNYFMNNNSGSNNKISETYGYNNNRRFTANANYIINGQLANIKNKNNMRRSMDNLLEIETNYPQNFQVYRIQKFWLQSLFRPFFLMTPRREL